ncbi:MAG: hypothetical protein CVV05_00455 [Gammaproteobacteria bacterium HGW-Gammaproteobacteria-1]|jgi:hypothetical protein|nr:MAG: hypothetical protein CVV05_00455 [Gammaproteobacteria bacterium HGW-Gammaproteobacteria-1]
MCIQPRLQDDSGVLPPAEALEVLISSLDCRANCPHASCHLDALTTLSAETGAAALERFEHLLDAVASEDAPYVW